MKNFYDYSNGKALTVVTAMILERQGKQAFQNGKGTSSFWRLRKFLSTQDRSRLNILYDYLLTIQNITTDSLGDLFEVAERYRQDQIFSRKEIPSKAYGPICIKDVLDI